MNHSLTARAEAALDKIADSGIWKSPWILLPLLLFTMAASLFFLEADPDLFARVAVGRLILSSAAVPVTDPFAFTATKAIWHDHEWLISIPFSFAATSFGDQGLFLLKFLFAVATFAVCRSCVKHTSFSKGAAIAWLFLCSIDVVNVWLPTVRAQVITYLMVPVFLLAFIRHRYENRTALLLALPILTVVWANSHGGFVVGLFFVGTYAAVSMLTQGRASVVPIISALGCGAATLVNPYGLSYWGFIAEATSMAREHVTEWGPLPLVSVRALLMLMITAILAYGTVREPKALPIEARIFGIATFIQGFQNDRLTPLFMLVAACYGGRCFEISWDAFQARAARAAHLIRRAVLFTGILFSAASVIVVTLFFLRFGSFSLSYSAYPVRAIDWVWQTGLRGNLLVHFNEGSYALWRLYPRVKISLDGRYEEVYPDKTFYTVLKALTFGHPEQLQSLRKVNPDFVLLHTQSAEFEKRESAFPGYQVQYTDPVFSVLVREEIEVPAISDVESRDIWAAEF